MNETQFSEIRNYLISKKLPVDILMEVEDHFVAQINELEQEGLEFSEAFRQTKEAWADEFSLAG